ncbi:Serine/threonine-protein kinase PknF [Rubripirellula lacrimiformis]|uniref:Serine/threonine-protein kinase PknF n=1 Tax=Rubripirellula lacrimiformis TaxID=1930273 RepID=A0A517N3F2_9BACT|nr:protein kinase [Rubripirellula lacrimiformis]QDT01664.1 Serine/threonine-protein kinase PknF [Rubripirellula lacrimiformis]
MMTATKCPPSDRLKDFTLGRLPDHDSDELLVHLADCSKCQNELDGFDSEDDSLVDALRDGDAASPWNIEPDCQLAVDRAIHAIGSTGSLDHAATIGEYEIIRPLGRGGMGNVYLARHTKLGRQVALKVLAQHRLADARMRERFEGEMRAVGRLSHPGVVTAHDARDIDGTAVLVTEYIDGLDLGQLIARTGPIDTADACEIVRQVAVALQYTSDQGFVHRDVKPSNVMLGRGGEVKLLDLGLARLQDRSPEHAELTATGHAMGTADYIAPEQVSDSRQVDVRADIYALGCTLFKLLTGSAPFVGPEYGTVFAKMTAHVSADPPALSDQIASAPADLVKLVASMLAKDPASRPQTPDAVARALATLAGGSNLPALIGQAITLSPTDEKARTTHPAKPRTKSWWRRTVPMPFAIGAGFLGLIIGLFGGMFGGTLIRVKHPDGTVVTMEAPEGSEISIQPKPSVPPGDDPQVTGIEEHQHDKTVAVAPPVEAPENVFLMLGILATDEQAQSHMEQHGFHPTAAPAPDSRFHWVRVDDPDIAVPAGAEADGIRYGLIDTSKSIMFADGTLRREIETIQSRGTERLELRLTEEAGNRMKALTGANLRRRLAIMVNGSIRMAPIIQSQVGRDLVITGKFTQQEVQYLMDSLSSGLVNPVKPAGTPTAISNAQVAPKPNVAPDDQQRFQGVWRSSASKLFCFDGNRVYLLNSTPAFDFGKFELQGDAEKQIKLNFDHRSPFKEKALKDKAFAGTYRFLADDLVQLLMVRPSLIGSDPDNFDDHLTDPQELLLLKRLGDLPVDEQEVEKIIASAPIRKLDSGQREATLRALLHLAELKSIGLESYLILHQRDFEAASPSSDQRNLKMIGLAFHNFHSAHKQFPASVSIERVGTHGVKKDDKIYPFSWRVAILPFIEEADLFQQYRFNEPWDSESNLKLIDKMPAVYGDPSADPDLPTGHTSYQGIADGSGAMGQDTGTKIRDIRDGLSNTILVMKAESSVPWTKPADLTEIAEMKDADSITYLLAHGWVQTMKPVDVEKLQKLITKDGGEVIAAP